MPYRHWAVGLSDAAMFEQTSALAAAAARALRRSLRRRQAGLGAAVGSESPESKASPGACFLAEVRDSDLSRQGDSLRALRTGPCSRLGLVPAPPRAQATGLFEARVLVRGHVTSGPGVSCQVGCFVSKKIRVLKGQLDAE